MSHEVRRDADFIRSSTPSYLVRSKAAAVTCEFVLRISEKVVSLSSGEHSVRGKRHFHSRVEALQLISLFQLLFFLLLPLLLLQAQWV